MVHNIFNLGLYSLLTIQFKLNIISNLIHKYVCLYIYINKVIDLETESTRYIVA